MRPDASLPQLVRQPPRSKLCGQACLATILGTTLDDAVGAVGHRKGTKTAELARTLRHLDYDCADRLKAFGRDGVPFAFRGLGKLRRGSGGWHWVVLWDGYLLDPDTGYVGPIHEWRCPQGRSRLTSGLEVLRLLGDQ